MTSNQARSLGSDCAAFAEDLAPVIDRLFIAGHRAASLHAGRIRSDFEVQNLGILIDLRAGLLSTAGVALTEGAAIQRYVDGRDVAAALEEQVRRGLLSQAGEQFFPTERGRQLLTRLTEALIRGTTDLWAGQLDHVKPARDVLGSLIPAAQEALPQKEYPAFTFWRLARETSDAMSNDLPPADQACFGVWTEIATLRYLRADAHVLAWHSAGLSALQADCLTLTWRATNPTQATPRMAERQGAKEALTELEARGLILPEADGWRLTDEGRSLREEIEAGTNLRMAMPLRRLSSEQRATLLQALNSLRVAAGDGSSSSDPVVGA